MPHESQLGVTRILSRSMTFGLRGSRFIREVMARLAWMRLWSWDGTLGVV